MVLFELNAVGRGNCRGRGWWMAEGLTKIGHFLTSSPVYLTRLKKSRYVIGGVVIVVIIFIVVVDVSVVVWMF